MKIYESRTVRETKDIHTKTMCNKCRKEVSLESDMFARDLMFSFSVKFGYGNKLDGETWEFDLCEECILDFVKTFKVMPSGFAYETKYPEKVFEEWKTTGLINFEAGWTEKDEQEWKNSQDNVELIMNIIKNKLQQIKG